MESVTVLIKKTIFVTCNICQQKHVENIRKMHLYILLDVRRCLKDAQEG